MVLRDSTVKVTDCPLNFEWPIVGSLRFRLSFPGKRRIHSDSERSWDWIKASDSSSSASPGFLGAEETEVGAGIVEIEACFGCG